MCAVKKTIHFGLLLGASCVVGIWSQQSDSYQTVKLPNGTALCSTLAPTATKWLPTKSAAMRCGFLCQSNNNGRCFGYNVRTSTGQCDLYNFIPRNFSVSNGCVFFALKFKAPCRVIAEAYGPPQTCGDTTFPDKAYVTVNGQTVFYDWFCAPTHSPIYRGVNLFSVDLYTCTVTLLNTYDTLDTTANSDAMASYIMTSLPAETVLIGVSCDEPMACMTSNGYTALAGLGVNISSVQQRGKFAFITQIGYTTKTVASIVPQPYSTDRAKIDVLLYGNPITTVVIQPNV